MRITRALFAALTIACFCGAGRAQSSLAESTSPNPAPVSLPFFVVDGHGNPSKGVAKEDISILDRTKHALSIETVYAAKDMPLRIGILIDVSRSAAHSDIYGPGVQATLEFLKNALSGADDKAFLVMFDATPVGTGFMTRDQIADLKVNLPSGGGTALYDAIYVECTQRMKLDPTQPSRRVLLILSDGDDNLSHVTRDRATAAAQQARTVIFAIDTGGYGSPKGRKVLEQITEQTGGRVFDSMGRKDLSKAFASLGSLLGNMQTIRFIPSESAPREEYRNIELKIATDNKLKVRAPKGYYGSGSESPVP
jgi:Ca-activated chloride channel family protein